MSEPRQVVVVGGGISGLAAAWALTRSAAAPRVTLLEADDRFGGKIKTSAFAGALVEEGPDAFLARRPEAVDLCGEVGLGVDLVAPAVSSAMVWSRGRLRRLPEGQVLGVPSRLGPLLRSGILSPAGAIRAAMEPVLPGRATSDADAAIGKVVRRRFGREVNERLTDPLLGGINAGRTLMLSADVVAPQVVAAARRERSLSRSLRRSLVRGSAPTPNEPVFLAPKGGMGRLVDRLESRLRSAGVTIVASVNVDAIERHDDRWTVLARGRVPADAVVLAVPSAAAADLLTRSSPDAARQLRDLRTASVALITLAFPRRSAAHLTGTSGFLVPQIEGRLITACTYTSSKWSSVDQEVDDVVIVRASVGRIDDERFAAMDDETLVEMVATDVRAMANITAHPVQWRVSRWPRSFPQFEVGHLDRVEDIEAAVARDAPGIALAGASYRGVGIPACIASARRAVSLLGY
ncbi:MAG TPA: protoporphyrinogen oxidase [Acidimicrobiales bacterium]|nr:protoporphyrinogen oxidase [Acidimicrobiales bacterium]